MILFKSEVFKYLVTTIIDKRLPLKDKLLLKIFFILCWLINFNQYLQKIIPDINSYNYKRS